VSNHSDPYHFVNKCWGYTFGFMVIITLVAVWGKEFIRFINK
jgi:hypothetical protein